MSADFLCPHFEDHTESPSGYLQWHAWAEKMARTHRQVKCGGCGKWSIWIPKRTTALQESQHD